MRRLMPSFASHRAHVHGVRRRDAKAAMDCGGILSAGLERMAARMRTDKLRAMQIDPKSKLAIDAIVDAERRRTDRRAWSFWITIAVLSIAAGWVSRIEWIPGAIRIALLLLAAVGAILFLGFLSTKPFGRGFYNGPEWWDLWWW
jgi:hypothetical protein